jgi:ankyrin repeat protein
MTTDQIKAFVLAGHGNFTAVKTMLEETPELLNVAFEWRPGDFETALAGASHVGNAEIALYLLERGAPMTVTTAAMLGRTAELNAMLEAEPDLIHATGAHGITLLTHAALSGDAELVSSLFARGATNGASMALNLAVHCGHLEVTRFLLGHAQPDLTWKNFKGLTALEVAKAEQPDLVPLLEGRAG